MHNTSAQCVLGVAEICQSSPEELFAGARGQFVAALGALMLVLLTGHVLHVMRMNAVPESLVTVLWGALLGVVLWASPLLGSEFTLDHTFVSMVMKWLLNLVALPIIIFEAGWSLRLRDFISQLGYILLFAIVGTVICILVVAALINWTSSWHGVADWRTAFAYASLISSVDPIATLATFNQLNVDPLLFILVFGESQINDAVAITLFDAFNAHSLGEPLKLCLQMAYNLLGSIGAGLALAIVYILILRFSRMGDSPAQAILFVFASCFFTFSVAEIAGLSGIIAVLFNSILMGAYTGPHLTTEGMALSSFLLKQMSSLADALIFIFCGVLAVFVVTNHGLGVVFGLSASLFCFVGRFMAVVPLGLVSNGIKALVGRRLPKEQHHMISWKHMLMMWHSGLRGGISIVLAMDLGDWVDEANGEGTKQVLVNGTFILVVLYLLVFGGSAGTALRCLGLPLGDQVPEGQTLYEEGDKSGYGWRSWMYMRKRWLLPLLVGSSAGRDGGGGKDLSQCGPKGAEAAAPARRSSLGLIDVIQEAEAAEHMPEFGTHAPSRRHSSVHLGDDIRRSSIITLFGTDDPAHVDACEDIAHDLQSSRHRGAAQAPAPAPGTDGAPWRASVAAPNLTPVVSSAGSSASSGSGLGLDSRQASAHVDGGLP